MEAEEAGTSYKKDGVHWEEGGGGRGTRDEGGRRNEEREKRSRDNRVIQILKVY